MKRPGAHRQRVQPGPAKRFMLGFAPAAKAMDWLDYTWTLYIVGCGILAGLVVEILMDQFP